LNFEICLEFHFNVQKLKRPLFALTSTHIDPLSLTPQNCETGSGSGHTYVFHRIEGDSVMSNYEEQTAVKDGLQLEGLEMEFFKKLLESALILPMGAECCHFEEFSDQ
jgi:hypothetical protein